MSRFLHASQWRRQNSVLNHPHTASLWSINPVKRSSCWEFSPAITFECAVWAQIVFLCFVCYQNSAHSPVGLQHFWSPRRYPLGCWVWISRGAWTHVCVFCVLCCVGSGLTTGRSLTQGRPPDVCQQDSEIRATSRRHRVTLVYTTVFVQTRYRRTGR